MLSVFELSEITNHLNYLVSGVKDNGLSKEQNAKIMNLSGRCLDTIDEIEGKDG